MSPQTTTDNNTATGTPEVPARKFSPVTRTVFDLGVFDKVELTKDFVAPTPPTSIEQALALVGNDSGKLLNLIYEGMIAESRANQYNEISGFHTIGEDGEPAATEYAGKYADGDRAKAISLMVNSMAKAFSAGTWDSINSDAKKSFRNQAIKMVRENPAMLAMVTG